MCIYIFIQSPFKYKMARLLRENSRLPVDGWSRWVRAIVPAEDPDDMIGQHYESRGDGQTGVICGNIRIVLPDEMAQCGIYEWKAVSVDNRQLKVVYVGSTCRAKRGALRARVLEYCTSGSHKEDLINKALEGGYELWVRVKTCGNDRGAAEDMENELLETYNYAWNFRNNVAIRQDIL